MSTQFFRPLYIFTSRDQKEGKQMGCKCEMILNGQYIIMQLFTLDWYDINIFNNWTQ